MRFEIQLILWVTAVLLASATIFVGANDQSKLALPQVGGTSLTSEAPQGTTEGEISAIAILQDAAIPEIDTSCRALFPQASPQEQAQVLPNVDDVLPRLSGIYSLSGEKYAVVFDGTRYLTLQSGGEVGDYVVVRIAFGEVDVQRKSDGVLTTILLRGAGELP
jgi:hypothetical protein